MTKFTKILATVAMLWLVAVHATPLMAQQYSFKAGQLYYKITNTTNHEVAVTSENSSYPYYSRYDNEPTGAIAIPATVNWGVTYKVTSIGESAFSGCSGLTSITIPNSVTSIEERAFSGCSITSITIPNSVTSIEERAFYYCYRLTSINIPNGVTSIGASTFYDCYRLTSINIPSSVTSIGKNAFESCSGLTSINIPNSVTSIGQEAFKGCSGLTSINIPSSVTSIGQEAFKGCSGLTSINIPSGVTKIEYGTFSECSGLTSITIPNSVTSIGGGAFAGCSGLTSINIPNSVTSIGQEAFKGCRGLTSIAIPNSVTSIGKRAFESCSGLTSINIPNSVTSIGYGAFYYCYNLTSIAIPASCEASIAMGALAGCRGLTSINIPNSVTSIGDGAFSGCSGLTSINIPNSVTSIGGSAFYECRGLTSITIPNSVTSIGGSAFSYCSGLTSITIPNSVTSIGQEAFSYCSRLRYVTIPGHISFKDNFGTTSYIDTVIISGGSTTIRNSSFESCSKIKYISIPNSVTSIGDGAFYRCSGLTYIAIPGSVTSIGQMAFAGCSGLAAVTVGWQTPLAINQNVFNGVTLNRVKLIVPAGRKGIYRAADVWKRFSPIVEPANYTITYNQSAGGTFKIKKGTQYVISGSSVIEGTVLTVEATPAQGYKLDSIKVNGARISGLSFTVDSNSTVEAYFSKTRHAISYTQPANGTLTIRSGWNTIHSGDSVEYGTVLTVKAIPYQGYKLDSILVNGARISGFSFTVDSNSTVEAFFSKVKHIITYNQSVGGTLTVKDGTQTIDSGSSVEYGTVLIVEATPAQGYKLNSIKVNDTRISGLSFTVNSNSTVEAYFSKMKYTITYTQPTNGTLTVKNGSQTIHSGDSVEYGTVLTVEATPYHGYMFDSIRVNGARIAGDSFTVDSNSTIEAFFFSKIKYPIIYNQPVNGTLAVKNGSQTIHSGDLVEYGTVLTIEATPYHGYKLDSIKVNGARISGLSFTVTDNTNIEVFFGKQSYTVTYNSNMYSGKIEVTRGSEIVASGSSVEYGTQLMVRAIPNHGFEVKSLTINDQAIANNFVFSISESVEIKAVFAPATTALDEAATKPLAIYPNPVAEVLYLSATARTIRIYDMYGTEVAHATDTDKVEVSHLPAGVYTVRADGSIAKMIKR